MTNGNFHPHEEPRVTAKDRLLQTIAILGLIAVLLLGAWGIIQLAFNLPGVFSSVRTSITGLFNRNDLPLTGRETLSVTSPQIITSEQPFTITWRHASTTTQYGYTISYSCVDGVTMKAPLPTGSYQAVTCGTPFNYTNAKDRTTLVPTITKAGAKVNFTVSAVRLSDNRVAVSGTASSSVATKASAAALSASKTSATQKSAYFGYPDLAVRIITVVGSGENGSVQFSIQNVGSNVAYAGWTFNAILPVSGSYLYPSAPQQPLYPGDSILYTLNFGDGYNGYRYEDDDRDYRRNDDGAIIITADPQNAVLESNEGNNTASVY